MPVDRKTTAARLTITEVLVNARAGLARLDPAEVAGAVAAGAVLIDVRTDAQIATDGAVAGAVAVALNHLEWRLDPTSTGHVPGIASLDDQVILLCDEGYSSSLAASRLQLLGFEGATDVIGGFQAWCRAGLPVVTPDHDDR